MVFEGHVEAVRETSGALRDAGRLEVRELFAFFVAHEQAIMRDYLVLVDFWRLHPEERGSLEPLLREAHDTYAEVVSSLLGAPNHGLGELMISALFNLLEQRWFHGPAFNCDPQLALLERLVASERAG